MSACGFVLSPEFGHFNCLVKVLLICLPVIVLFGTGCVSSFIDKAHLAVMFLPADGCIGISGPRLGAALHSSVIME